MCYLSVDDTIAILKSLALSKDDDEQDIYNDIESIAKILWFDYFRISIFRIYEGEEKEIVNITNFPEREWIEIEPMLRSLRYRNIPMIWWDLPTTHFTLLPGDSQIVTALRGRGIARGLSAPVHDLSNSCWSLFSLATRDDDPAAAANVRHALLAIPFLARCLHEKMMRLCNSSNPIARTLALTKRESECLQWCAEGKTSWEISKILGISERTVVFHFQNAARKLGVSSRTQAVVKAIGLLRSTETKSDCHILSL